MNNRKMSLILTIAMLFTIMFNTMAFAEEEGFEGDAAQVQNFILKHADAESVMSETFIANTEAWSGGGLWIDADENGSVSNEEAEMVIWFMQGMNLSKAYLVTSSTSYQITLLDEASEQDVNLADTSNTDMGSDTQTEQLNESSNEASSEGNSSSTDNQNIDNSQVQELELTEKQDFINIEEERAKHLDLRAKAYINESFMGYKHLAYPTIESEVASDEYIAYADSYSPDYLVPAEEYRRAPSLDVVLKSFPIENYKNTDFTGLVDVDGLIVDREKIDQLSDEDVIETVILTDENTDIENVIEEAIGNTDTSSNIESIIDADNESNIESDESNAVNTVSKDADNPVTDVIEKVIENEKAKQDQLEDIISTLDEVKATDEKPVRVDKLNEAIRAIDEIQNNSSNVVDEAAMKLYDNDMSEQAEVIKAIKNKNDENAAKLDEVRNIISEILDADTNEYVELIQDDIRDMISESEIDIQALEELNKEVSEILSPDDVQDGFEALEKSLDDSEGEVLKMFFIEDVEDDLDSYEEPYRWKLTISLLGTVLFIAVLIFAGIAIKKSRKKGE